MFIQSEKTQKQQSYENLIIENLKKFMTTFRDRMANYLYCKVFWQPVLKKGHEKDCKRGGIQNFVVSDE